MIKQWLGSGSINLFGRPFAGKDTQGNILANLFGGHLIGGGEILRGSEMPDHIKRAVRTGELIPSQDYVDIVLPYLTQEHLDKKPLILSSVGRWHGEEMGVTEALNRANHPLRAVIYIALDDNDVMDRWKDHEQHKSRSERHDDSEEILKTRFKEFRDKTIPVLEHYHDLGLLIEIDGTQTKDAVTHDILTSLAEFAERS